MSEEALAAASYQPMTLLRISACASVGSVFPAAGGHNVQRESSEGCAGSLKVPDRECDRNGRRALMAVTETVPV